MKKIILLLSAIVTIFSSVYAQCQNEISSDAPGERVKNRLRPGNARYGNPYTMFKMDAKDFDYTSALNQIRLNIKNGNPKEGQTDFQNDYAYLYHQLFVAATDFNEPAVCPQLQKEENCMHPQWVKNNAIIYLVGLKYQVNSSNIGEFVEMNDSIRNYYAERAYIGLKNLNPKIEACWSGSGEGCDFLRNKAPQLVQYLQAYDLLKTGGKIAHYADDNSSDNCNPRNKLRQFASNMYKYSDAIINSTNGWKKNSGIICASAIGMAAIVLNDAGSTKRSFKPKNWFNRANGIPGGEDNILMLIGWGEDGIEDNFFIGDHGPFAEDVPQSSPDGKSGYAEGPDYFHYTCRVFLPYLRALNNYLPDDNLNNFLKQERYKNILLWSDEIVNQDGSFPSYDNSSLGKGSFLQILGEDVFHNTGIGYIPKEPIDLRGDYIFAFGAEVKPNLNKKDYLNSNSGNILMHGSTEENQYSFHMLAEKDFAIDKASHSLDKTHDDDDLGSFMIYAGTKNNKMFPLGIDPPYLGWTNVESTNKYWMHNVIEMNRSPSLIPSNLGYEYKSPTISNIENKGLNIKEFELSYICKVTASIIYETSIKRNTFQVSNSSNLYYLIVDYINFINSFPNFQGITLTFNGNGRYEAGTPSFEQLGNLNRWFYPCRENITTGWQISSHHAALAGAFSNTIAYSTTNESNTINGTRANGITNDNHLTRLKFYQPNKPKTIFQSVYFPQKCGEELPKVYKLDSFENKLVTIVEFKNQVDTLEIFSNGKNKMGYITDTVSHFHLSKWIGAEADSVQNPFRRNNESNKKLYFNAQKLFVEKHSLAFLDKRVGFCPPTYANFRNYFANDISYLIFGNDTMFYSDKLIDADFALTGRHSYHFKITPKVSTSSSDSIKIKLPDVARGTDMVAIIDITADTLKGRYDSLNNFMYLVLPQQATGFSILQKDLCSDCYFPPLGTNFDTLFVANDGLKHILGNSKKIKSNYGQVKITNSTRIEMCPGVILHNQDSIIVEGPPQSEPMNIPSCSGVDNLKKYSKNSMLIVSPYAALVLDANSKTYIKNGAGLYIKQNGSLVVKSGALLEIGDSGTAGYGEFYAEAGSFIYIEPGAIIRYRRAIADTIDRNYMIFGMNSGGVVAGLPYQIDSVLKADSIIPSYNTALAICDLDSLNPIGNKHWGYTNFGKPEAKFFTRSLNLCEGEPFHISLKRMLNDATLKIKVCKMDSILVPDGYGSHVWKYRCLQDSLVLDSVPPDPTCLLPRISPEEWTWYFPANTLHRVQITVTNECGKMHDTTVLVRVLDSAQISLSAPTIACEGIGTVKVIPSLNQSGSIKYVFEVSEVLNSINAEQLLSNPAQEYSYQQTGILPDTFSFPGMYFKGGRKYLISFSYISNCGVVTAEKEVNIPTGAFIKSEKPTVFANPLHGARSVQLHGYISLADSFKWSPTYYLNRTDTLVIISTPEDPINYVLQAYYGSCTASDTIEIKYNRIANAGEADTVCFGGNEILVGNAYDASMFLAYLYYKGGSEFRDEFIDETTNDNAYFQDFTRFMHTAAFKDWLINCGSLNEEFTEDLMKEICIKKPWYRTYFKQLNEFNDADMPALDGFVTNLNADSILRLNFINTGDWANIKSCIPEVFAHYDNFKSSSVNDYSISWTRISGDDTLQLTHYSNLALTIDSPWQTSIYIQQAITPYYAEFDETITYVDTITQTAFLVAMQMDSTVFFENISTPESNSSSYTWNFGDGTSSINKHAIHTFPKFDTSYLVCLSVSNHCGTYAWCDTIYIDSAHWNQLDKTVHINKNKKEETINIHLLNLEALVYPNPTESNALLVFKSEEEHFEGKLVITDIGGRSIWESDLKQKSGNIKIPSQHWHDGLYFFHLQTSSGTKTGKFIVRH